MQIRNDWIFLAFYSHKVHAVISMIISGFGYVPLLSKDNGSPVYRGRAAWATAYGCQLESQHLQLTRRPYCIYELAVFNTSYVAAWYT